MCCITETARASQRSSFLAVADYSWVILYYLHDSGIWRLPLRSESCCAGCLHGPLYLLLIHIDSSYVSGWSLCDDLGFISPEYHMKQAGTFAGQFFLAPFLLGNLKSGSVVVFAEESDSAVLAASPGKHSLLCSTLPRRQGLCCFSCPRRETSHDYTVFAWVFTVAVPNSVSCWHISTSDFFLLSLVFYELLKYMQKIVIWLV